MPTGRNSARRQGQTRKPAHQNATSFKNNPHSTKSVKINSLPNEGLCQRCHDIIEWRKKYHKFKPLKAPKTCVGCGQKTVVHAYHVLCINCARERGCCSKCLEKKEIVNEMQTPEEVKAEQDYLEERLAEMSLRKRRTFYRKLERGDCCCCSSSDEEDGCCDSDCSSCDDDGDGDDHKHHCHCDHSDKKTKEEGEKVPAKKEEEDKEEEEDDDDDDD